MPYLYRDILWRGVSWKILLRLHIEPTQRISERSFTNRETTLRFATTLRQSNMAMGKLSNKIVFSSKLRFLITGEYLFQICDFNQFAMLRVPSAIPDSSKLRLPTGPCIFHFASEIFDRPQPSKLAELTGGLLAAKLRQGLAGDLQWMDAWARGAAQWVDYSHHSHHTFGDL